MKAFRVIVSVLAMIVFAITLFWTIPAVRKSARLEGMIVGMEYGRKLLYDRDAANAYFDSTLQAWGCEINE